MTTRMRDGLGLLCVGLVCLLIGYLAGAEAGTVAGLIRAAGFLLLIGGGAVIAVALFRGPGASAGS